MTVSRIEVGLVSSDEALATFYVEVFGFTRLPVVTSGSGVLHPLQAPGVTVKIMIPSQVPVTAEHPATFLGATGIRYLTLHVTDLVKTTERALAGGGRLVIGPLDIGPGRRLAVICDPDGNALEVVESAL